jgi:hypothetical protein
MRKGKPGRIPTDIAGAPNRESQIRQDEREKVLDELVAWVNLGNFELEKHFPCDRLMIKLRELRQEGKDGE